LTVNAGGTATNATILSGGDVVVTSGGTVTGGTIGAGAALHLEAGSVGLSTALTSGGAETLDSGSTLVSGSVGSGALLSATAGAVLQETTVSAGGTLAVASGASESGVTLQSGATLSASGGVVGSAGATISADGSTIAAGAGTTIAGTLAIGVGGVVLNTEGSLDTLAAQISGAGTLSISGGGTAALTGTDTGATVVIDAASTLDVNTQAAPASIVFGGSGADVIIEASAVSAGVVSTSLSGMTGANSIDLAGFTDATSAVLSGGLLQITNSNGDHVLIAMADDQGSSFTVASDGQGGTVVSLANPYVTSITATPSHAGPLDAGQTILFTVAASGAVAVNTSGGSPTLTLSNGEHATYVDQDAHGNLVFQYAVTSGDDTPDLTVMGEVARVGWTENGHC
jgi:autotransporter passenger strand-loop-strand repeat protein